MKSCEVKIIHCPTSVGGNPINLARSERELGLNSHSVSLKSAWTMHLSDEILLKPSDSFLKELWVRYKLYKRALKHYDIIHFNFGQSFTPNLGVNRLAFCRFILNSKLNFCELSDLPRLKKAGKKIFFTFQGDDARQGDYSLENFEITFASEVKKGYYTSYTDEHKRWRIEKISRYADKIYSVNPDLLHILPEGSEFIPYASVNYRDWDFCAPSVNVKNPLIMHAPTHQDVKGTAHILSAIERLQAEDYKFRFELINLPYKEAIQKYREADLMVDQLLAGWYGGLATELMALGKPVISYIREADLKFIPKQMKNDLPIINANPSDIYEVLKGLLDKQSQLHEIGCYGRKYVKKWHDPMKIAAKLKKDYLGIKQACAE